MPLSADSQINLDLLPPNRGKLNLGPWLSLAWAMVRQDGSSEWQKTFESSMLNV